MKPQPSAKKLRGGYYTPDAIAEFITEWAVQSGSDRVLEPSCGGGVFLKQVINRLENLGAEKCSIPDLVQAVEIDLMEVRKARKLLQNLSVEEPHKIVLAADFFKFCNSCLKEKTLFDVVIGNPPFIRYQNFPQEQREIAMELMKSIGLKPNRLTNTWLPFLIGSSLLLEKNGRLGMVIPAELLQVNYAAEVREFLSEYFGSIVLITFSKLVFEGIQQEVILFLGERKETEKTGIQVVEFRDLEDLNAYDHIEVLERKLKPMDHTQEKWTQYFLEKDEIILLRELRQDERITKGRDVLDVDVGVVTGQNSFFILTDSRARELAIKEYTIPIVTRSGHFDGIVFTKEDCEYNLMKHRPALMLRIPAEPIERLSEALSTYIASGEEQDIHKGYKCSIRDPWYTVPSVWTPDGFMLRQIHEYPKIIINRAGVTSTDTIHRVRMTSDVNIKTVAVAFLNSLTFAFSEVLGRSYGGGVLEMYPGEIANLPIPLDGADMFDVDYVNQILNKKGIEAVLDMTDRILLLDQLGLNHNQVNTLRNIWYKLRDRRIRRKK